MEKQLLNTLVDETLQYLHQLKADSPYILCDPLHVTSLEPTPPTEILHLHSPIEKLVDLPPPQETLHISQKASPAPEPAPPTPVPICTQNPPKMMHKDSMQDLQALLAKIAPTLTLHAAIPNDAQAKRIKNTWKEQANVPDVVVLATPTALLPFLHQLARAIELHFFPSRVVEVKQLEESNSWDAFLNTSNLKMVITPDSVLWSCKHLLRYYHEFPNKQERFLGKIPLLLLPDPSLYLKDPALKRSLWNLLCHMPKPLQR